MTVNGVPSTSTAAPNDIALSVMPGPTDATPAPSFGAPTRIPIEADAGASSNTVDHFIPAIAADPNTSGATAQLALFYYFYPLRERASIVNAPGRQCPPQVGYISSTNGGASWALRRRSAGMPSLARLLRATATGNGNPDLGNVHGPR